MNINFTKNEIQELLTALYASENLNTRLWLQLNKNDATYIDQLNLLKPTNFLRVGNKPINTVFEKLMNAKYSSLEVV